MTKSLLTAVAAFAVVSSATAGTSAPAPVGKGNSQVVPTEPSCPPLSYSNFELGWVHRDADGLNADGAYLDLNYSPVQNFFLEANVDWADGDFEQWNVGFGAGGYVALTDRFHFVLRGGYYFFDNELDNGGGSYDENGLYVAPGFRAQLTCNLEFFTKLYCSIPLDPDSGDTYLTLEGGLAYNINDKIGLVGRFNHDLENDDSWSVQAGVRVNF